jgi:hypothetical protein
MTRCCELLATLPLFPNVVEKLRQEQQQVTYLPSLKLQPS